MISQACLEQELSVSFFPLSYAPSPVHAASSVAPGNTAAAIHLNPVRAGVVEMEEEYPLSNCGDFYGSGKGGIDEADICAVRNLQFRTWIKRISTPCFQLSDIAKIKQQDMEE
ncbi:hypothetical protein [Algoriphagus resistens]|uniref:hypothetical protein n=1 Tax=Algoriphagus resistens TaxID=1750590 RepID=UPI0007168A6D|nr:hypothetical protein [Algoriphagus resistens]